MFMKNLSLLGAVILLAGCSLFESETVKPDTLHENYKKSIAAPYLTGKIDFDGRLDEKMWRKAGFFDDFVMNSKFTAPHIKTEVRVFHDTEYLYFGIKCYEKKENIKPINSDGYSLWQGDCIELFLGNMEPEPYLHQFCWGSGSARYGANAYWDSKCAVYDDFWTTETRIKLSLLKPYNGTLAMHLARLGGTPRQSVVWNSVGADFQNIPQYSELILGSYDLAAQAKFQYYSDRKLTRSEYEKLNAERTVNPASMIFGPWLFAASETEMNIGWYNEGRTGAILQYRKKGDKNFKTVISHDHYNYSDKDKKIHKVQLKNLQKGTTYEYFITNTYGQRSKSYPGQGEYFTFTTHGKKDLTIAAFSDVHNDGYALQTLLANKKVMDKFDILVNVGDMTSNSTGSRSIIHGYLAGQLAFASKKPVLNFRGNHEYAGFAPGSFFEMFGTPDFKGYSINRFGDVCIIGLDCMNRDQRAWLKKAVKTPEFQTAKHRIMFAHFPPTHANREFTKILLRDTEGIFTGKNPSERLDLLISGHTHRGSFTAKNSDKIEYLKYSGKPGNPAKVPFPVIVNEGNRYTCDNVMTAVEAKGDSLTVKLYRMDGTVSKEYKIKGSVLNID
ncbi:MAG: fibronectin type III domain-containing protein [Lentisphaeria bacterium]|nr:fibronectin type III domain-containing protein [Lentisphaeria bacterium]